MLTGPRSSPGRTGCRRRARRPAKPLPRPDEGMNEWAGSTKSLCRRIPAATRTRRDGCGRYRTGWEAQCWVATCGCESGFASEGCRQRSPTGDLSRGVSMSADRHCPRSGDGKRCLDARTRDKHTWPRMLTTESARRIASRENSPVNSTHGR